MDFREICDLRIFRHLFEKIHVIKIRQD
jgi:hypothetical protein